MSCSVRLLLFWASVPADPADEAAEVSKCSHNSTAAVLQFIRHPSHPEYTPEPDLCHELLGHVPMLTDPAFSDMVFHIGLASLAADEAQIWHLSKLFW